MSGPIIDDSRQWYGWKIIACELMALISFVGGGLAEIGILVLIGGPALLFASPFVHGFNDNRNAIEKALASLGYRLCGLFFGCVAGWIAAFFFVPGVLGVAGIGPSIALILTFTAAGLLLAMIADWIRLGWRQKGLPF